MTVSARVQAQQVRTALWGPELVGPTQIPPTGSTTLWTVTGGSIAITALSVVVATSMSGTATTLNIGTAGGATTLLSAGVLTSLTAGARVAGIPVITTNPPAIAGHVVAAAGAITWIASATQTGTCFVTMNYIPLNAGATVG